MKSSTNWLPIIALAATVGASPLAAQEADAPESIIEQMDQVLVKRDGRSRAEIEAAVADLNRALNAVVLGASEEDSGLVEVVPFDGLEIEDTGGPGSGGATVSSGDSAGSGAFGDYTPFASDDPNELPLESGELSGADESDPGDVDGGELVEGTEIDDGFSDEPGGGGGGDFGGTFGSDDDPDDDDGDPDGG